VLATHQPVALADATVLALGDFAASAADPLDRFG